MPLVKCPKCGKKFSDRIDVCPECGLKKDEFEEFVVAEKARLAELERIKKAKTKKILKGVLIGILFLVFLTIILPYIVVRYRFSIYEDAVSKEIQLGDSCLNIKNYVEADNHYATVLEDYYFSVDELKIDFPNPVGVVLWPVIVNKKINQKNRDFDENVRQKREQMFKDLLVGYCWYHTWGHEGFDYLYFEDNGKCWYCIDGCIDGCVHHREENYSTDRNYFVMSYCMDGWGHIREADYSIDGNLVQLYYEFGDLAADYDILRDFTYNDSNLGYWEKISKEELIQEFIKWDMDLSYLSFLNVDVSSYKTKNDRLNLCGRIGSADDGTLEFDEENNTGCYSYGMSGATVKRNLQLESHFGESLKLNAFDKNGQYIGIFDGVYSDGVYNGTFTNNKNVSISFSLHDCK